MDENELHKLLGPPIIIDESKAIHTCLSCNYVTDKLFQDLLCMNCTNDTVGRGLYYKENEQIILEKSFNLNLYDEPSKEEQKNPVEEQKRLEELKELKALFSSTKGNNNQKYNQHNHYPDYYNWLTEEFGDDAYVAYWNMD